MNNTKRVSSASCPHCGTDLLGELIPEHVMAGGHRYHRALAIEIRGVYDGVLFDACPDCHRTWHRWSPQHDPRLYEAAEKHGAKFTEIMAGESCSE